MLDLTKQEWAYIAGFIDGEGCMGIYFRNRQHIGKRQLTANISYRPRIAIVNTNKEVLQWLQNKLGGYLRTKKRINGCKSVYQLEMTDCQIMFEICRNILPYLIVKKEVAKLVLDFPFNIKCNQYTKNLTLKTERLKRDLYNRTKILNKRGEKCLLGQ